ncbi:condensation domain-containing protein [Brevibacillus sp. SYSU BS000544]|uniref:condensation domain-containing protein n=1 Tax=Brevibacillus sp. SYSU BS000544 TaxID=3416443 RepID=UPI003CE58414
MLDFKNFDVVTKPDVNLESTVKEKKYRAKDIAIIGMAFKLPRAEGIEDFWNHMREGADCIADIPEKRKEDVYNYFSYLGKNSDMKFCEMAYLDEIDKFDHRFFSLSPKEASLMDPNQRLFLEVAWQAVEDAGYGGDKLKGSRTGVYSGYCHPIVGSYMDIIKNAHPSLISMGMLGNMPSMIPSRIGYFMDFRGPNFYVDTACSSSLVALHQACQGLRNGDSEIAIVGTTELVVFPVETEQKMGIESKHNRTKAFDDESDGTGVGEGVISLVLKPVNKALQDRDHIYAVIKGTAINQDGNSIGITAPNSVAQEDAIVQAWKDAGINPETISYIEAHGTATNLGDPIEIDGISRAFKRFTNKKQFCAISALKSNIGHLGAAAGLAGVVKAVLAMKHSEIPPVVHLQLPNRKIDFENSPVYVNDMLQKWDSSSGPKRCGVSSFGLSGTNCHVVLEEAPVCEQAETDEKEQTQPFLTISAKSESALKNLVAAYAEMLEGTENSLADICFTANTGRGHYSYRLAVMADSKQSLLDALKNASETGSQQEEWTEEKIRERSEAAKNMIRLYRESGKKDEKLLREICELYLQGANIQWEELYHGEKRKKVSIPAYPFDKIRCWVDIPADQPMIKVIENHTVRESRVILKGREGGVYSEIEEILADSWGKALGYKELSVTDNYYELGGDSVIGIQLVNEVSNQMQADISLSDLLVTQTIEKMAEIISEKLKSAKEHHFLTIKKADEKPHYPLSSAQKRMYITSILEEANTAYNMYGACIMEGDFHLERFESTLNKMIARHEAFRTSFQIVNGEPVQIIHPEGKITITVKEAGEGQIQQELKHFIQPFDFATAPLLRCEVLKIHEDKHVFLFDMPHIITDGYSISIFVDEFMNLYDGEELPDLPIQYKDYSVWQNQLFESEEMKKQEEYWLNKFSGEIPVLDLPYDFPRPSAKNYEGDTLRITLKQELAKKVNLLAKSSNTTLYNVLLAAYQIVLMKHSGQEDIIIGSASAGRQNVDCEKIIGMFVNMLAMRNYPQKDKSFSAFLAEVTSNSIQAFDNQAYQFEKLVDKLGLERNAQNGMLFDATFTLQNIRSSDFVLGKAKITTLEYKVDQSPYALSLIVFENKGQLELSFEYQTALFKSGTIEQIANHFVEILSQVTENRDVNISQIQLTNNFVTADTDQISEAELAFDF